MLDFTREAWTWNYAATDLTAVGPANRSTVSPAQAGERLDAGQLTPQFVGHSLSTDLTVRSSIRETDTDSPTCEEWSSTAGGQIDPQLIAALLARTDSVHAVYVSNSQGRMHVWTVVHDYSDVALEGVFERELELHDCFGERLASVEFHVLAQDTLQHLEIGDRIFKRVRH